MHGMLQNKSDQRTREAIVRPFPSAPLPSLEEILPDEVLEYLLRHLTLEELGEVRSVSKGWRGVVDNIKSLSEGHQADRCRVLADHMGPQALWAYLLLPLDISDTQEPSDSMAVYQRYLTDHWQAGRLNPQARPAFLSYTDASGGLFDPEFLANASDSHYVDEEECLLLNNILNRWKQRYSPGSLFGLAGELTSKAQELRERYPEAIAWILESAEERVRPEGMSQERAEAYFVVVQYLERVAAFEQMLLELVTFQAMLHSSIDAEDQDLFVLSPKFVLTHRLSKAFYLDYLKYLEEKLSFYKEHVVAALSSPAFVDLLGDDEALLSFMGDFWGENQLPVVFKNNPSFYQRMHPALWKRLCEETSNYIHIVICDPRIYQTLSSEQLLNLVLKGTELFQLYQKDLTRVPPLLQCLEVRDLISLCDYKKHWSEDEKSPVVETIHKMLLEKFHAMTLLGLEVLEKELLAPSFTEPDPLIAAHLNEALKQEKQAALLQEQGVRQQRLVAASDSLVAPAKQTVARPAPFVFTPAAPVKQTVVSNASPTILKRASIAARWKALPMKWKLLAGILVLLGIAAIVAAAVFCPPSLAVTLPVAGKVAVSTLVVAGGSTVVVTTLLGHGIHTVRTSLVSGASEQTEPVPEESAPAAPAKETSTAAVSDPLAFQGLRDLEQSALVSALKSSEPLSRTASKNVDVFAEGQRRASGLQQLPPAEVAESEELFYCP